MSDIYLPVEELAAMCDALLADKERAEAMVERLIIVGNSLEFLAYHAAESEHWNALVDEWRGQQ